jgi:hypothetical protein
MVFTGENVFGEREIREFIYEGFNKVGERESTYTSYFLDGFCTSAREFRWRTVV